MDKYNINEHPQAKKVFRKYGPLLLAVGGIMITVSIVDFFISFGDFSGQGPTLMFLFPLSFPFLMAGFIMTSLGYQSALMRYQASQVAPVAKDVTNYMLDNTKDSIAGTVGAIVREIKADPTAEVKKTERKPCPFCNEVPNSTAIFCDSCGRPLQKECSHCKHKNDGDASFCEKCGKRL